MKLDRRTLMGLAGLTLAQSAAAKIAPPSVKDDPPKEIALWPGEPPGAAPAGLVQKVLERDSPYNLRDRAVTGVTRPTLSIFPTHKPNGSVVLIIPGGSYARVVRDKEGFETARLFAARGVTAFVLLYRLPAEGWPAGADAPLQDAQRALRAVRAQAAKYKFSPAHVGVLGFSAGGHVAGSLLTRFGDKTYDAVDATDALSARPDFAGLLYPVISMGETASAESRTNLIGANPAAERIAAYSLERHVTGQTPPTFLCHAADDTTVPLPNSLLMYEALQDERVPAELHVFEKGGHGFGLRGVKGLPVAAWPDLFLAWAASQKTA